MTRKIIASMLSGAINPPGTPEKSPEADNVQQHPASQAPRKRSPVAFWTGTERAAMTH